MSQRAQSSNGVRSLLVATQATRAANYRAAAMAAIIVLPLMSWLTKSK
jgi:hypothetical protein